MIHLYGRSRYDVRMDREVMLAHLRRTRFAPGDRRRAVRDARAIADYLKEEFGARVIGIGSAFAEDRPSRQTSDIDLVVDGLPPEHFWRATARAAAMTDFPLDVIPLESATPAMHDLVRGEGVEL